MSVRESILRCRRLIACSPWLLALALPLGLGSALAAHEADESESGAAEGATEESGPRPKAPEFRSPISSFKPFEDIDSPEWRAANDRVGEIGGWRAYAREAFESPEPDMDSGKSVDGGGSQ